MREKKLEPAMETNFERISYSEDEISLVDLVVTLLKRRKVFYLTFGVLLIITIFFTALTFLNKNGNQCIPTPQPTVEDWKCLIPNRG